MQLHILEGPSFDLQFVNEKVFWVLAFIIIFALTIKTILKITLKTTLSN